MSRMRIDQITVGERRREELGDIDGLAQSIKTYGLLHPIVVDATGRLVAGERRLRAAERLGASWIDVKQLDELSDAELREIELEENLRRKDLTEYERSRTLVSLAETAREIARSDAETCSDSEQVSKPARGPARTPGSYRDVAQRTGVPTTTIHKAERHVATADTYPTFRRPDWKQYHVLEAGEVLAKLDEPEREAAVALIDQPGIDPPQALAMLRNVAETMPEEQRADVLRMATSDDRRERSMAQTVAAQKPPMPDPILLDLQDIIRVLKRRLKESPDHPLGPRIASWIDDMRQAVAETKEQAA